MTDELIKMGESGLYKRGRHSYGVNVPMAAIKAMAMDPKEVVEVYVSRDGTRLEIHRTGRLKPS